MFSLEAALETEQRDRVRALRASRDQPRWKAALAGVEHAARSSDNLVPAIIAAVEAHATVGEIADTMRAVFGEFKEIAFD
jgi:methylmalonyl-CoA mutase N-terminal domain/subunit